MQPAKPFLMPCFSLARPFNPSRPDRTHLKGNRSTISMIQMNLDCVWGPCHVDLPRECFNDLHPNQPPSPRKQNPAPAEVQLSATCQGTLLWPTVISRNNNNSNPTSQNSQVHSPSAQLCSTLTGPVSKGFKGIRSSRASPPPPFLLHCHGAHGHNCKKIRALLGQTLVAELHGTPAGATGTLKKAPMSHDEGPLP